MFNNEKMHKVHLKRNKKRYICIYAYCTATTKCLTLKSALCKIDSVSRKIIKEQYI